MAFDRVIRPVTTAPAPGCNVGPKVLPVTVGVTHPAQTHSINPFVAPVATSGALQTEAVRFADGPDAARNLAAARGLPATATTTVPRLVDLVNTAADLTDLIALGECRDDVWAVLYELAAHPDGILFDETHVSRLIQLFGAGYPVEKILYFLAANQEESFGTLVAEVGDMRRDDLLPVLGREIASIATATPAERFLRCAFVARALGQGELHVDDLTAVATRLKSILPQLDAAVVGCVSELLHDIRRAVIEEVPAYYKNDSIRYALALHDVEKERVFNGDAAKQPAAAAGPWMYDVIRYGIQEGYVLIPDHIVYLLNYVSVGRSQYDFIDYVQCEQHWRTFGAYEPSRLYGLFSSVVENFSDVPPRLLALDVINEIVWRLFRSGEDSGTGDGVEKKDVGSLLIRVLRDRDDDVVSKAFHVLYAFDSDLAAANIGFMSRPSSSERFGLTKYVHGLELARRYRGMALLKVTSASKITSEFVPLGTFRPMHSLADYNPDDKFRSDVVVRKLEHLESLIEEMGLGFPQRLMRRFFHANGEAVNVLELPSGERYLIQGHHRVAALILAARRGIIPDLWLSMLPVNLCRYDGSIMPEERLKQIMTFGTSLTWDDMFPKGS